MVKRTLVLIAGLSLALFVLAGCGNGNLSETTSFLSTIPSSPSNSATAPFNVTSVGLTVKPDSIAGLACGTPITLHYTAIFHIAPKGPGGTIQFGYTTNNGRSETAGSVVVVPGQTITTYKFSVTGTLYPDHTFPGVAIVMTHSPNTVQSPGVKPTGACS